MQQAAYELERFADRGKTRPPRVRVAKSERRRKRNQTARTVGTVVMLLAVLGLVCGVLYTQSTVTELQSRIAEQKKELVEQEAMNAYLNFELENSTNMAQIEQRAIELGMRRVDPGQVTYIRVQEGTSIEVKQNPLERLLSGARSGLLNIFDFLFPE